MRLDAEELGMTGLRFFWLATAILALALAGCGEGGGHENDTGRDDGAGDIETTEGAADADADEGADADADADTEADADVPAEAEAEAGADGDADAGPACNTCHGDSTSNAPPASLDRSTSTSVRGVGAHRSHLGTSAWHHEVRCDDCHVVPATLLAPGHIDTDVPAEITWNTLAVADGASPTWDRTTCSGVYCHGATLLPGGTNRQPAWTTVDGSQAACGTCHSLPPGGTHPALTNCPTCHGGVIGPGGTWTDPSLHIDGIVQGGAHPDGWSDGSRHGPAAESDLASCETCHGADLLGGSTGTSCESCHAGWRTNCTFCHGGTDNMTGAPPEGVGGETDPLSVHVGAHTSHVEDTATHLAYNCNRCHVTPADATSPGHMDGDGRGEVFFDPLNPAAAYDRATATCSSLYCHGNGQGNNGRIVWNTNPTLTCASCHNDETTPEGSFTMSGEHWQHVGDTGFGCVECHSTVVDTSKHIIDRASHVDGDVDVSLVRGGTWNPATMLCSPACHETRSWLGGD
jgi:predicted CxxxxCH...CXXCH cytochrome family protein